MKRFIIGSCGPSSREPVRQVCLQLIQKPALDPRAMAPPILTFPASVRAPMTSSREHSASHKLRSRAQFTFKPLSTNSQSKGLTLFPLPIRCTFFRKGLRPFDKVLALVHRLNLLIAPFDRRFQRGLAHSLHRGLFTAADRQRRTF